ncbi:MAG: TrkH family potassium uptake protein [Pacificimonas sp.]|jgi:trk system potassium uptake protein TrkH|nr:TrkH family potassium uptake protein [Pacificimonas sp.]
MKLLSSRSRLPLPAPLLLTLVYAVFGLTGAALLCLPAASAAEPLTFSEALFTATSAVTVTGLVVVDTGSDLSFFGQVIVALLIQLGGLGLMVFATLVMLSLGIPIGFEARRFLKEDLGQTSLDDLFSLVGLIFRVVLICEAIGVVLIGIVTIPEFGWAEGLWQAVFHSISAFNNAGFALFPDSLTRWGGNPFVNISVPLLFIVGGLGFGVLWDMAAVRNWRDLTLHSKLTLVGTGGLIVTAVTLIAILEWSNAATLGAFTDWDDKLWRAWFQGVTPRTAGFNTLDVNAMREPSVFLITALMFIGGGTTSTAGGIKVTTFVVLLLATYAFIRRRQDIRAFGRSLGVEEVLKVLALLTIGGMVIFLGAFLISLTFDGDVELLLFEVVSAFGTVGLSRGATGELDQMGRVVIIAIMFIGRVGPLMLGVALAAAVPSRIKLPKAQIHLG